MQVALSIPEVGGQHSEFVPEIAAEVFGIVESHLIGDFGDGALAFLQELRGPFEADEADEFQGCPPRHRRLFTGIYQFAGQIRDYNISKKEWVLDGASVLYSDTYMIRQTLDYDFAQERKFSYSGISLLDTVRHIAGFISGIWQIHAFGEGNTRTTAVFAIKYLRSFGFYVDNDLFEKHSWYFRNALVRANYNNFSKGITATDQYLVLFFRNLILDENNTLSNREMHVSQSIKSASPKSQFDTLNCTLEELAVLKAVRENPHITQAELKTAIGKSIATIKRLTISLQGKGILVRKNGKRNGWWEISD